LSKALSVQYDDVSIGLIVEPLRYVVVNVGIAE
jgi:hypothetical protein